MVDIEQVKKLREETGVSISECKRALEEARGELDRAKEILREKGIELAGKRAGRAAVQGIVESYIHPNKRVGVLLELRCESDFVARSVEFQKLAHDIAAMNPVFVTALLSQPWIKDPQKTIKLLLEEAMTTIGENIIIKAFARYEI
jgi:elongation factor Ts